MPELQLCAPASPRIAVTRPNCKRIPISRNNVGSALCEFHLGSRIYFFADKETDADFLRQPQAIENGPEFRKEWLKVANIGF